LGIHISKHILGTTKCPKCVYAQHSKGHKKEENDAFSDVDKAPEDLAVTPFPLRTEY
jgi:hypothetical protein